MAPLIRMPARIAVAQLREFRCRKQPVNLQSSAQRFERVPAEREAHRPVVGFDLASLGGRWQHGSLGWRTPSARSWAHGKDDAVVQQFGPAGIQQYGQHGRSGQVVDPSRAHARLANAHEGSVIVRRRERRVEAIMDMSSVP